MSGWLLHRFTFFAARKGTTGYEYRFTQISRAASSPSLFVFICLPLWFFLSARDLFPELNDQLAQRFFAPGAAFLAMFLDALDRARRALQVRSQRELAAPPQHSGVFVVFRPVE